MPRRLQIAFAYLIIVIWLGLYPCVLRSQTAGSNPGILFYQLNTSHGLSDNYIHAMCTDKSGNLWVGTGEGLNMFNGKTVTKFFRDEYPQLQNDYVSGLLCDDDNRVWVLNEGGFITLIDENRRFRKVVLNQGGKAIPVLRVFKTANGIVLLTSIEFLRMKPLDNDAVFDSLTIKNFEPFRVVGFDTAYAQPFKTAVAFGDDGYISSSSKGLLWVDFKTGIFNMKEQFPNLKVLTQWRNGELLVYDKNAVAPYSVDPVTNAIMMPLDRVKDQHGKGFTGRCNEAIFLDNKQLWITTASNGLYQFDVSTNKLVSFKHSAADPTTIANNAPLVITSDASGWIFTGNTPNGVSYFKNNAVIGQQLIFTDNKGNGYDGYINSIATIDNDHYFIAISDNLMVWKRSSNSTEFLANDQNDKAAMAKYGVNFVAFDNQKRLWACVPGIGVFVLDEQYKVMKLFSKDSTKKRTLPSNSIRHLKMDPEGKYMWLSTRTGLCRINIASLSIEVEEPAFAALKESICNRTWFYDADNVWVATDDKGAWHYNFSTKQMVVYNKQNGGIGNSVFCFNKDAFNNMYIGTATGLQIRFNNGITKNITPKDGLLHRRIEALLLDKSNRMWIGNDVGLSCFSIADTSIRVFDERYGLSVQGFRVNAYHLNSNDELVWGTERGLQYFYPDQLWKQTINLTTTISRVETRDVASNLTRDAVFLLSATDNYVTFYFSAIDYSKHLRTFYEYRLEGLDKDWVKVTDQNFVRYSSLPAGKYTFTVRASNDGKVWEDSKNKVTINIARQLWQRGWFKLLAFLAGLLLIWFVIRYYRGKQKRLQEILENKQKATESRLQSLRLQMNPHFLFNALNSIQQMILANEDIVATKYLSRFSKLLRAILVHSDKESITLREELEILNLYIELESIRFKESFSYTISVDDAIETEEIKIPTLLVQPFVENAIWHGLMHKEGHRVLQVTFAEEGDFIQCVIEDNGIGRQKAAENKLPAGSGKKHDSKGIAVSKERLKTLRTPDGREGAITITDLTDADNKPCGTRVTIHFPIQN